MRVLPIALGLSLTLCGTGMASDLPVLSKEVVIHAGIAETWAAWTTESGLSFVSEKSKVQLCPGGAYEWFLDGEPDHRGRRGSQGASILAFLPGELLVFAWTFPPSIPALRDADQMTQVIVRFDDLHDGTVRVRLDASGWKSGVHWQQGWDYFDHAWGLVLDALKRHLEQRPPAEGADRHEQDLPGIDVRSATVADASALLEIYRPNVEQSAVSFELAVPSVKEFEARIAAVNETHAWIVAESDGRLLGYAYATAFRPRPAYRHSVEVTAYVDRQHQSRGIGGLLYTRLFSTLRELEYFHAYAAIALPNPVSSEFHRRLGFRRVGTLPSVGFKFSRWHDLSWWYRRVQAGAPGQVA